LRNAVIEEIVPASKKLCPGRDSIDILYSGTCEGDPARRLMVDLYAKNARTSWLNPGYNSTFVLELAQKLLGENGNPLRSSSIVSADYLV
jgi:hypothetical protein